MAIREIAYNTVHDSQAHFRKILYAMARPGLCINLDGPDLHPPLDLYRSSASIGLALMDRYVQFYCHNYSSDTTAYLALNTGAAQGSLKEADFIFVHATEAGYCMQQAKMGSLEYPDESATLIIQVEGFERTDGLSVQLQGPGIEGQRTISVSGIEPLLIETFMEVNSEYPLGIDCIFAAPDNSIMCIPRTSRISTLRT